MTTRTTSRACRTSRRVFSSALLKWPWTKTTTQLRQPSAWSPSCCSDIYRSSVNAPRKGVLDVEKVTSIFPLVQDESAPLREAATLLVLALLKNDDFAKTLLPKGCKGIRGDVAVSACRTVVFRRGSSHALILLVFENVLPR